MRRVLFVTGAVVCAVVSITAAQTRTTPSLHLTNAVPVGVTGAGFHSREHVRVTLVTASGNYPRRVIATKSGLFVVTFSGALVDRCGGFQVFAVGNHGSRAAVKRPPLPACMPA